MEITDEQLRLESMAESILRHIKEQGGSINLESHQLRDVFNNDPQNVERVSRLLTAHGLTTIPYGNNPHHHRITKEGWYFSSFKQERWELEETKRLEAEQRQSIIDTNKSVKETNASFKTLNESIIPNNNKLQRNIGYFTLGIAALSLAAIAFSAYYSSKGVTSEDIKSLNKQLQNNTKLLEKMQQSQKEIDSSLEKAVNDSFYAPLPRHK